MADHASLLLVGASHHTAPIGVREKFAVPPERVSEFQETLHASGLARETVVLNTCNRTEIYAVVNRPGDTGPIVDHLCAFQRMERALFDDHGFVLENEEAVRHLFEVASGVDSMVLGETEILGQVKSAYASARGQSTIGPLLNRLFQKSFQAAKWARTHTGIGRGQVSVGTVAVDLAGKVFGKLERCRILLVGAGEISERTLTALKNRGASSVTITNRTDEKALELARRFEGTALPFQQFPAALTHYEILICSTASPEALLSADRFREIMRRRSYAPLFAIDLALPRDIDPAAADVDNLYLYNIDDLSAIADDNLAQRQTELIHCREQLQQRARGFWKQIRG